MRFRLTPLRIAKSTGILLVLAMLPLAHGALNANTLRELIRKAPPSLVAQEEELEALREDREQAKQQRETITELRRSIAEHKNTLTKNRSACLNLLRKVEQSRNINSTDEHRRTLLMLVAAIGNDQATALVLKEQPRLNMADNENRVAYDYEQQGGGSAIADYLKEQWSAAVTGMQTEALDELLDCGADPNWPVEEEAPLILALRAGRSDIFSQLIGYGASVEARDRNGRKLIELTVLKRDSQSFIALMEKGCKPDTLFSDKRPMFEHLLAPGAEECLNVWIDKADAATDGPGHLCNIVRRGTPQAIQVLFNSRKDKLNEEDTQGNIPLHEAARRGDTAIYRQLLQLGAEPHICNMRGETPLMHAALSGSADMLQTILTNIPESHLRAQDEQGHTAIYYARLAKDQAAEQTLRAAGLQPHSND